MIAEIKICACIYEEEKGKIVLYYVGDITVETLAAKLKETLPRYMVPNHIEKQEGLPFTANGKIDRVLLKNKYKGAKRNGRNQA